MKTVTVAYNDGYDVIRTLNYTNSAFQIDEAGTLYIHKNGEFIAAFAKNTWRTVNAV